MPLNAVKGKMDFLALFLHGETIKYIFFCLTAISLETLKNVLYISSLPAHFCVGRRSLTGGNRTVRNLGRKAVPGGIGRPLRLNPSGNPAGKGGALSEWPIRGKPYSLRTTSEKHRPGWRE